MAFSAAEGLGSRLLKTSRRSASRARRDGSSSLPPISPCRWSPAFPASSASCSVASRTSSAQRRLLGQRRARTASAGSPATRSMNAGAGRFPVAEGVSGRASEGVVVIVGPRQAIS